MLVRGQATAGPGGWMANKNFQLWSALYVVRVDAALWIQMTVAMSRNSSWYIITCVQEIGCGFCITIFVVSLVSF